MDQRPHQRDPRPEDQDYPPGADQIPVRFSRQRGALGLPSPRATECQICMENFPNDDLTNRFPHKCTEAGCEGSQYCRDCLKNWFIEAGSKTSKVPVKCCKIIPISTISTSLHVDQIEAYNEKYEEWQTSDKIYCPDRRCSAFISPKLYIENSAMDSTISSTALISKPSVDCPKCATTICTNCRSHEHTGACPKSDIDPLVEDYLRRWGYKRCPGCRTGIRKIDGCVHMECRCGVHFCWMCLKLMDQCPRTCFDDNATDLADDDDENGGVLGDYYRELANVQYGQAQRNNEVPGNYHYQGLANVQYGQAQRNDGVPGDYQGLANVQYGQTQRNDGILGDYRGLANVQYGQAQRNDGVPDDYGGLANVQYGQAQRNDGVPGDYNYQGLANVQYGQAQRNDEVPGDYNYQGLVNVQYGQAQRNNEVPGDYNYPGLANVQYGQAQRNDEVPGNYNYPGLANIQYGQAHRNDEVPGNYNYQGLANVQYGQAQRPQDQEREVPGLFALPNVNTQRQMGQVEREQTEARAAMWRNLFPRPF